VTKVVPGTIAGIATVADPVFLTGRGTGTGFVAAGSYRKNVPDHPLRG